MDNIGSAIGVRQEALAVYKHSKCGRPNEIYKYHHLDGDSIVEACGKVLSETALEQTVVSTRTLASLHAGQQSSPTQIDWRQLWPERHDH
jgi:pyruvate dehydrogenase E1 component